MEPLAALNFSSPLMLIGLFAAVIPVVLHLLNRLRSPVVPFSTLRFLRITAQKTARRRHLENFLLLLLRMAVFAMIAMAVAGPLVHGGSPLLAYGMIGLLLVGMLLVAIPSALIWGGLRQRGPEAVNTAQVQGAPAAKTSESELSATRPGGSGALSRAGMLALIILGLLCAGGSLFGLSSNFLFTNTGGPYDGSSTACVIILDNSQSMLARIAGRTRLEHAVKQAKTLLTGVLQPAQMAVFLTNPGPGPRTRTLSGDRIAELGRLDKIFGQGDATASTGQALPMQMLITRAVHLLHRSGQANRMLVIISDFAGPAASNAGMFQSLKSPADIQLVLMPQAGGSLPDDVGIEKFAIRRGQAVVGANLTFQATVINNGQTAVAPRFALNVDDRPAGQAQGQAPAQLGPAGTGASRGRIRIHYQLTAAGYHRFTLAQIGPADALPWADQRSLVLRVANKVKTLVVGDQAGAAGAGSAAFYVQTALAPFAAMGRPGEPKPLWSIAPAYVSYRALGGASLQGYAAVFVCDVPDLDAAATARLKQFVQAGGRLCWLLGPAVNPAAYGARLGGGQIFPGRLAGPAQNPGGDPVGSVDLKSHIFSHLFDSQAPFQRIVVVGRWNLAGGAPAAGDVLCRLRDQAPLLVEQSFGLGRVYTLLTAPAGGWTNLADTTAFLPMMVRIALGTAAAISRQSNYEPQQPVLLQALGAPAGTSLNVQVPGEATPLNVSSTSGPGGHVQWRFNDTYRAGLYQWQSFDQRYRGQFVVNEPSREVNLQATAADVLAKEAPVKQPVLIAATAHRLGSLLAKNSRGSSLMPGLLALVLILAVLEALLANRYQPARAAAVSEKIAELVRPPDSLELLPAAP